MFSSNKLFPKYMYPVISYGSSLNQSPPPTNLVTYVLTIYPILLYIETPRFYYKCLTVTYILADCLDLLNRNNGYTH